MAIYLRVPQLRDFFCLKKGTKKERLAVQYEPKTKELVIFVF
jgi:hypothetical protein